MMLSVSCPSKAVLFLLVISSPLLATGQGLSTLTSSSNTRGNLTSIKAKQPGVSVERLKSLADEWRLTTEEAQAIGEPHGAGK